MRGDWPALSYISKCNLEARGQSAEERSYIDRPTKVPHVLVDYLNDHLPCLGGWDEEGSYHVRRAAGIRGAQTFLNYSVTNYDTL